jgi:hypothetical protein
MYEIGPVAFGTAAEFVTAYHRHHNRPRGWKFGAGLYQDGWIIGVVMVGRPVARAYDNGKTLEVNRLCVLSGHPNGCSMLYSWAYREAHRRGFKRILTYIREDEPGTSLKASGWVPHHSTKGAQWSVPSRPRQLRTQTPDRIMWIPSKDKGLWPPIMEAANV